MEYGACAVSNSMYSKLAVLNICSNGESIKRKNFPQFSKFILIIVVVVVASKLFCDVL